MWTLFLQKTQAARPEEAEAHSPGQHPGYKAISNAPCKGKSFKTRGNFLKLLPLQGDKFANIITQGDALG